MVESTLAAPRLKEERYVSAGEPASVSKET
jgi:hypothetical protein